MQPEKLQVPRQAVLGCSASWKEARQSRTSSLRKPCKNSSVAEVRLRFVRKAVRTPSSGMLAHVCQGANFSLPFVVLAT